MLHQVGKALRMEANSQRNNAVKDKAIFAKVGWGLAAGAVMATSVSWFAGMIYREGSVLAPATALTLAIAIPFALYEEPTKRVVCALLASALLSGFSLLALGFGGQATGPTVFGLSVVAIAIPVGVDLILQDFGKRLTISPLFSRGAAVAFLSVVLPLSGWIIAREHFTAVAEDDALIRTVAQNVSPEGDTIVFDQVDPRQKDKLKNLVSVRTNEKTYRLSDAEIESVVEERTVRRETREQGQPEVVSRKQEERMRIILKLQGAPIPGDIIVFSQRGPITVSELKVPLEKKNPG
jgi:hypothetical protein